MLKLRKNKKGFTLVELIVVIAIMAVLAGTVAGVTVTQLNKSKNDSALSDIKTLLGEFESFLAGYDTSLIKDAPTAEAAVNKFNTEKKAAKGLDKDVLTKKGTGAIPKAGPGQYVYTATVADGKLTLKIECDKVGSTGAKPEAERAYEI